MGRKKKGDEEEYWDGDVDLNSDSKPKKEEVEEEEKVPTKKSNDKKKPPQKKTEEKPVPQKKAAEKPAPQKQTTIKKEESKEKEKDIEDDESKEEESSSKTAPTKKGKKAEDLKKKGGISKKMAEAILKMKEEEDKRKQEEEERAKKEEEEYQQRLIEIEKAEKIKEEKLLIKKQKRKLNKEEAEKKAIEDKAAAARERFAAQGFILPTVETTKKPQYGKKKPQKKNENKETPDTTTSTSTEKKEEEKPVPVSVSAPVVEEEKKKEEEEAVDDWEAKDSWEDEFDEEKIKEKERLEKEKQQKIEKEKQEKLEKEKQEKIEKEKAEKEKIAATKGKKGKKKQVYDESVEKEIRSPICCVLGHVDTGKTKILDNIRRSNVQEGEAGGITQQIGATYFPMDSLKGRTATLFEEMKLEVLVPGLLIIDTPGHESFTNLRSRGSSLCDIAILVVDIMHGLEPQTIESLNLLKQKKIPFVIALNKIDRIYGWKQITNSPFQTTLETQDKNVKMEFEEKIKATITLFAEQSMNAQLYFRNKDMRKYVSIIPTSAVTGEGIPDLLMLLVQLTQRHMTEKLTLNNSLQCTVLEVKVVEGLGTTIDVILVNGVLHEGDTIVVCGLNGPIVTTIRALLTPQPLKEIRVKGAYVHHKSIKAAMGIKIAAQDLDKAIAGSSLQVYDEDEDDLDAIKKEVMQDLDNMLKKVSTVDKGVYVQASTLGSLEALLEFLKESKIPVSGINIGPVNKKDVMKASIMLERSKEFAVILAFDVRVSGEAREIAADMGVRIFEAEIIYHLFDQFTRYMDDLAATKKEEAAPEAVFPCRLKIFPEYIFNKKDPIVLGVEVTDGLLKIGTPICVPSQEFAFLGRVTSIENNHKAVTEAKKGAQVAIKIENPDLSAQQKVYGRHFDFQDELVSKISRQSIDVLKNNFKDELTADGNHLVVLIAKLKPIFGIQ